VHTPLIICADDFGYSPAVDAGIAQLIALGRLTATSCLTAAPRWPEAAVVARSLVGRADLGLHLDLVEFARLASLPRLLISARLGLLDRRSVREQIATQLSRFEDAVGAAPDYVDGHQHVHQPPLIATELLEELRQRYAGRLPWIRVSQPAGSSLKSRIIAATGARQLAASAARAGFRHTRRLLGSYDFGAEPPYEARLGAWVDEVREGDALMVHPANGETHGDVLGAARQREFTALASPTFAAQLARAGVVPARGTSLAVAGHA
jgi:chitin disaccharide deacetylase